MNLSDGLSSGLCIGRRPPSGRTGLTLKKAHCRLVKLIIFRKQCFEGRLLAFAASAALGSLATASYLVYNGAITWADCVAHFSLQSFMIIAVWFIAYSAYHYWGLVSIIKDLIV